MAQGESPSIPPSIHAATPQLTDAEWLRLAGLAVNSPVVIEGEVRRVRRIGGRAAADVPAGESRHLVELDLTAALKAPGVLPARAEWLWQGPGRNAPVAKGAQLQVFLADPRAGPAPEVMQYRLIAPDAMRRRTPADDAALRAILGEARQPGAAGLMVTGVSAGFRTEGTVAGRSESQFFLTTTGGRPLTLTVTRTPDAPPAVSVATGDVIAASAQAIQPRTLVWRALSCGLPAQLPDTLAESVAADPGLAEDYALARAGLADCSAG